MKNKYEKVVRKLENSKKTISTMESCTGGALANIITSIVGSSDVLNFSAVTYSNDFKIKMGVPKEVIEKFTVYSGETAQAMAKAISNFTSSNYGVGITGQLNCVDPENKSNNQDIVYISIYIKETDKYYDKNLRVSYKDRDKNKKQVLQVALEMLMEILL